MVAATGRCSETWLLARWKRALRQTLARLTLVVRRGGDVVRALRVEDAGEPLDLRPTRPQLVLAASVHMDPALLARLDRLEQPADGSEARRLDVQPVWLERQAVEVGERVHGSVEAEAILSSGERLAKAVFEPRVLDDHVRKLLHDRAVQVGIRSEIDARAAVVR